MKYAQGDLCLAWTLRSDLDVLTLIARDSSRLRSRVWQKHRTMSSDSSTFPVGFTASISNRLDVKRRSICWSPFPKDSLSHFTYQNQISNSCPRTDLQLSSLVRFSTHSHVKKFGSGFEVLKETLTQFYWRQVLLARAPALETDYSLQGQPEWRFAAVHLGLRLGLFKHSAREAKTLFIKAQLSGYEPRPTFLSLSLSHPCFISHFPSSTSSEKRSLFSTKKLSNTYSTHTEWDHQDERGPRPPPSDVRTGAWNALSVLCYSIYGR